MCHKGFITILTFFLSLGLLAAEYRAGWLSNSVKIPQNSPFCSEPGPVKIAAAKNESESFQIIIGIDKGARQLNKVAIFFPDLVSDNGGRISRKNFESFLEYYHKLNVPSEGMDKTPAGKVMSGKAGEAWPDALLPISDFDVASGNQAVWCRLKVPQSQPAGVYKGNIEIVPVNASPYSLPVELTVWNFTLPERPAFINMSDPQLMDSLDKFARGSLEWRQTWLKRRLWLLDNGISGGYMQSEKMTTSDWMPLKHWPVSDEHERILTHPKNSIYALTFDDMEVRDPQRAATMRKSIEFIKAKKWDKSIKLIIRPDDEPSSDKYPRIRETGQLAHKVDPSIKTLLTCFDISPGLYGSIDIWCPSLGNVRDSWEKLFRERRAAGDDIWFYGNDFTFPIDVAAIHHRVPGMIAAKLDMRGQYIFGVNWWISPNGNGDPFDNIASGANSWNGGSWLTYPNYKFPDAPELIGSIRLSLLNEYSDDYEYFIELKKRLRSVMAKLGADDKFRYAPEDRAWEIANTLVRSVNDYETDPAKWFNVRSELAGEIMDTEKAPLVVLESTPRAGEVTDVSEAILCGLVESGSDVLVNGQKVKTVKAGNAESFKLALPLKAGGNAVEIEVINGKNRKVFKRNYVMKCDQRVFDTLSASLSDAIKDGACPSPELKNLIQRVITNKSWTPTEKDLIAKEIVSLSKAAYSKLLADAEKSPVPENIKKMFMNRAAESAIRGNYDFANRELHNLMNMNKPGKCQIIPAVIGDYAGYELTNGLLKLQLMINGARLITLEHKGTPMLFHGFIRALDIGDASYRDIGGLEEVIGGYMDHNLTMAPWKVSIEKADGNEIIVNAETDYNSKSAGLQKINRRLRITADSPVVELTYKVTNLSGKISEVEFRTHIEPAIGINANNGGGDPDNDYFVQPAVNMADSTLFKVCCEKYLAKGPRFTGDNTYTLKSPVYGAFDPVVGKGLVLVTPSMPFLYMWLDRSDENPYNNPWHSTRNKYTMEPNNYIGPTPSPFRLNPGESVEFTNRLIAIDSAATVDEFKLKMNAIASALPMKAVK